MKSELLKLINSYAKDDPVRFHMPGHKGTLCDYDITELSFSDDLHSPHGAIADIETLCCNTYNAKKAFLLVNGSSAGICAFCIALAVKLHRNPRILVSRDCHKSFVSGAFLSCADVAGVFPCDDVGAVITADGVENALQQLEVLPDAICITSPNYYGMCADVDRIAKLAHDKGILLFVDNAHGAHFAFCDALPKVPDKADVWVTSTHKTLAAFNQSGILLCNCDMWRELRVALSMMQTTSPSYPIMASIENGINTAKAYENHIARIARIRQRLTDCGIELLDMPKSAVAFDMARLCIMAKGIAKSGYELARKLMEHNIYVEMADLYCVVCITTPWDKDQWYERLIFALQSINKEQTVNYSNAVGGVQSIEYISIKQAMTAKTKRVKLKDAKNLTATCPVGVYPPGISLAFPGEKLADQVIESLIASENCGGILFGTCEQGTVAVKDE